MEACVFHLVHHPLPGFELGSQRQWSRLSRLVYGTRSTIIYFWKNIFYFKTYNFKYKSKILIYTEQLTQFRTPYKANKTITESIKEVFWTTLSSSVCELELPGCLEIRVIWEREVKVFWSHSTIMNDIQVSLSCITFTNLWTYQ